MLMTYAIQLVRVLNPIKIKNTFVDRDNNIGKEIEIKW